MLSQNGVMNLPVAAFLLSLMNLCFRALIPNNEAISGKSSEADVVKASFILMTSRQVTLDWYRKITSLTYIPAYYTIGTRKHLICNLHADASRISRLVLGVSSLHEMSAMFIWD